MDRPGMFAAHRYLGDKRTQVVYDVDAVHGEPAEGVILEIVTSGHGQAFAPDTLAEARNRGYRHRVI